MSIPISDGMTPKDHSRHAEANGWVGNYLLLTRRQRKEEEVLCVLTLNDVSFIKASAVTPIMLQIEGALTKERFVRFCVLAEISKGQSVGMSPSVRIYLGCVTKQPHREFERHRVIVDCRSRL